MQLCNYLLPLCTISARNRINCNISSLNLTPPFSDCNRYFPDCTFYKYIKWWVRAVTCLTPCIFADSLSTPASIVNYFSSYSARLQNLVHFFQYLHHYLPVNHNNHFLQIYESYACIKFLVHPLIHYWAWNTQKAGACIYMVDNTRTADTDRPQVGRGSDAGRLTWCVVVHINTCNYTRGGIDTTTARALCVFHALIFTLNSYSVSLVHLFCLKPYWSGLRYYSAIGCSPILYYFSKYFNHDNWTIIIIIKN